MTRPPLAGLLIRERDIEKAISDSGNNNLPEVELENTDGRVCVCVGNISVRVCERGGGGGGRRRRIKDEGRRAGGWGGGMLRKTSQWEG